MKGRWMDSKEKGEDKQEDGFIAGEKQEGQMNSRVGEVGGQTNRKGGV